MNIYEPSQPKCAQKEAYATHREHLILETLLREWCAVEHEADEEGRQQAQRYL